MSTDPLPTTDAEWQARLSPEQYAVCRCSATERAFTGRYWNHKEAGTYTCAACAAPLFASAAKYDSGSGWPSYSEPVAPAATTGNPQAIASCKVQEVPSASDGRTKQFNCLSTSAMSDRTPGSHANSWTPASARTRSTSAFKGPSPTMTKRMRSMASGWYFSRRTNDRANSGWFLTVCIRPTVPMVQ